ncbi:MAG: YHS domain-containing protein [Desulforhopalus sp.]
MSPLRIIIIAILIYLAYRLITGGFNKPPAVRGRQKKPMKEMPVSDTLEEDPVCKKLVPRQQAVEYEHQGEKHYFCSKECCNTFRTKQGERK